MLFFESHSLNSIQLMIPFTLESTISTEIVNNILIISPIFYDEDMDQIANSVYFRIRVIDIGSRSKKNNSISYSSYSLMFSVRILNRICLRS